MAIKGMIKNVKAAMGVKTKRSRNGSVKSAPGIKPTPLKTASDFDLSTRTDTTEVMMTMEPSSNLFEQAFFRNELSHLKQNVSIRRVTLQDFVQRYERGDLLAIHDAGAHGYAMGFQYNGKLRCAELLMKEDGSVQQIRRAETLGDYFSTLDYADLLNDFPREQQSSAEIEVNAG